MPNCDFYAAADDRLDVLAFIFGHRGWRLMELASAPDHPALEFRSLAEGAHLARVAGLVTLQLYAVEMKGRVQHRKIVFNPGAVPGATHRFDTEGWGLIQLYFGGVGPGGLSPSHSNHNTEARARKWHAVRGHGLGPVDAWDWAAVTRVSRSLGGFIRSRSPVKEGRRAVMPHAQAARDRGAVSFAPN